MTAVNHAAFVDRQRELHAVREELIGIVNTAASLIDRIDQVREQHVADTGEATEQSWERFLDTYQVAYSKSVRSTEPGEAHQEALREAFEELVCSPVPAELRHLVTEAQKQQLYRMRAAGWVLRVVGVSVERDGMLLVDGTEPNGDRFRGHLQPEGAFTGEPVDTARRGQIVGVAPEREHDRGGAQSGPNGTFR